MSEDFTQKLPKNGHDSEILTAIKDVDTHVTKIDNRLDGLESKVEGLERKVEGLERKVDERLYDTRPIWHKVVADIAQLQAGQERLEKGQQAMSVELGRVSRDQIVINDSIRKIHLDFHSIDDRLRRLETKS
jgi:chromosome segregation ATPase